VSVSDSSLERAYAACERIARQHYENFPVASLALPKAMRPHVAAVYAFARHADDLADEGRCSSVERLSALDAWMSALRLEVGRMQGRPSSAAGGQSSDEQVLAAVAASIHRCGLPLGLFEDLTSAFRQDVVVHRYDRWEDLLDYCRRSANPIGRLVLRIAGYESAGLDAASDHVCSALQLTNFLQDLDVDWRRGRLYVPREVYAAHGASENGLSTAGLSAQWKAAVADVAERTRDLFEAGRTVCDGVGGRLGLELRPTWLGGRRILDRLHANGYDPRSRRPTLGWSDALPIAWKTITWRYRS